MVFNESILAEPTFGCFAVLVNIEKKGGPDEGGLDVD